MTTYDDERLAELLAVLPPAPGEWVRAAQELPAARAGIDALVQQAEQDAAYRAELLAGLERALEAAGVEPRRHVVDRLRRRLEQ